MAVVTIRASRLTKTTLSSSLPMLRRRSVRGFTSLRAGRLSALEEATELVVIVNLIVRLSLRCFRAFQREAVPRRTLTFNLVGQLMAHRRRICCRSEDVAFRC